MAEVRRGDGSGGCLVGAKPCAEVMGANLLIFKTVVAVDHWGRVAVPVIQHTPAAAIIFCGCVDASKFAAGMSCACKPLNIPKPRICQEDMMRNM